MSKDQKRVFIITGGSSGVGAACAVQLAAAGHSLVINYNKSEALARQVIEDCEKLGAQTLLVQADMALQADCVRLVEKTVERFGHINGLVNSAAVTQFVPLNRLDDLKAEDFLRIYNVNAVGPFQMMRACEKHMPDGSAIVNVSSMLGRVPFAPVRSAYSAAKHALNSLTANLRMELRAELPDVNVSTVHPGVVATEFGLNALHGGFDSRSMPGAQSAQEVAEVIAELLAKPRADVYTRPGAREMVAAYYAAEDMGDVESKPPFMPRTRR